MKINCFISKGKIKILGGRQHILIQTKRKWVEYVPMSAKKIKENRIFSNYETHTRKICIGVYVYKKYSQGLKWIIQKSSER